MESYAPKDYRSDIKPIWCPGCGDFGVLGALYQALSRLQLPFEQVALVSGIGCSSRLPGYVKAYGFNSIHGRALPVAQGVKLARPEITVIAVGGDGDGLSIGGGHLPHIAKRNLDLTYIMMDNGIYGMTKGQSSPTTEEGYDTKTTPYGLIDDPLNPIKLALSYDITFIARAFSANIKQTVDLIVKGIQHPGFSFIQVLSPCVSYVGNDQFDIIRAMATDLGPDYDPTSYNQAWEVCNEEGKISFGVIYQKEKTTYTERLANIARVAKASGPTGFSGVLDQYLVTA